MSEPRLEDIGDYNTLKGEKKKVVWAVVFTGILLSIVYIIAYSLYDNREDTLPIEKSLKIIPMK